MTRVLPRRALIAIAAAFCGAVFGQSSKQDAADKKAFEAVCGNCHTVSLVAGFRSESEWIETVEQMVKLGARGSDEQLDRVMRFLLRTFTKVNINAATAPEIAPVLDIGDAAAEAVVKTKSLSTVVNRLAASESACPDSPAGRAQILVVAFRLIFHLYKNGTSGLPHHDPRSPRLIQRSYG